jgi:demethylmenaquinone methyltransferase/2-methoxy-6-polyprenyl-1,4-benzoquinol methylase
MAEMSSQAADCAGAVAPHPILTGYYAAQSAGKRRFVRRVFDHGAGDYDRIENLMAFGTGRWYRRQALLRAGLKPGMRVLDVATGTGLVAREQVRIVGDPKLVIGLDPSPAMLCRAVGALGIGSILGTGERLPLADASFDFVSMGYALRHLSDLREAFREFARVLRPNGRLCILEISCPRGALPRTLLRAYLRYVVPSYARFGSRGNGAGVVDGADDSRLLWQYHWDTIERCITPQRAMDCLRDVGFNDVRCAHTLGIFTEYTALAAGIVAQTTTGSGDAS